MIGFENEIAVLVATLFSMALGVVWYSPMVCGKRWMLELGVTEKDIDEGVYKRGWRFAAGFILHLSALFALSFMLMQGAQRGISFVQTMTALSIVLVLGNVSQVLWEKKSFSHLLVTGGYMLLFFWSGGIIIAYWPW